MILHTIYSVNLWLSEKLSEFGAVAFTEEQELALPGFRVTWGAEREAGVRPRGVLSGARFAVYCLASGEQTHVARRLATNVLAVLRSVGRGFTIPRYLYPREPAGKPTDCVALRDISSREIHLSAHPELAVYVVQATALALNPPLNLPES